MNAQPEEAALGTQEALGVMEPLMRIAKQRSALVELMAIGLRNGDLANVLDCAEQLCGMTDSGHAVAMLKDLGK